MSTEYPVIRHTDVISLEEWGKEGADYQKRTEYGHNVEQSLKRQVLSTLEEQTNGAVRTTNATEEEDKHQGIDVWLTVTGFRNESIPVDITTIRKGTKQLTRKMARKAEDARIRQGNVPTLVAIVPPKIASRLASFKEGTQLNLNEWEKPTMARWFLMEVIQELRAISEQRQNVDKELLNQMAEKLELIVKEWDRGGVVTGTQPKVGIDEKEKVEKKTRRQPSGRSRTKLKIKREKVTDPGTGRTGWKHPTTGAVAWVN